MASAEVVPGAGCTLGRRMDAPNEGGWHPLEY